MKEKDEPPALAPALILIRIRIIRRKRIRIRRNKARNHSVKYSKVPVNM